MRRATPALPTVLIVDDEAHTREALTAELRRLGYGVAVAEDGAQALEVLGRLKPAAMLVDLMMPVMDGVELRRRQLLRPELARIPVAFLASTAQLQSFAASVGAPILIKPAAPAVLAQMLHDMLNRQR